ncbi:hypothetical protein [Tardiphaga sp. vice278]|uniref:hypothetical protein n=1 Tax=Tardiphaga sp. vice278 TaxID=2592815 RepID=UPI001164C84F|nr:hypothetical protein [Tardiphaga sp. vice278]QDM17541.1 hypothetical protein FNL53_17535 [Tardiphaga sp. vice278]
MPYFHCISTILNPGAIIEPGNWGRVIRNAGWAHNLSAREVVLEHIRQREFADKPSRLDAAFFFDDENEARFYANSDGRLITMIPYEIELVKPDAPQHFGDWRNVAANGPLDMTWANRYWQGQMLPPHQDALWHASCREVLAVTAMKIIRRLP